MFLARVKGRVVSTAKDTSLVGSKLLIVEPLRVDYDDPRLAANHGAGDPSAALLQTTGRAIVAVDQLGAGEGQLVLVAQGSSARMTEGCGKMPIDAAIIGIVDEAVVNGRDVAGSQAKA